MLSVKHNINFCTRFFARKLFSPKNTLINVINHSIRGKESPLPPLPAKCDCVVVSSFESALFRE